ncbi:MAG: NAD-dependent epimerase/dehydratase family protein [Chloroflexaceae bacterium]
MACYLIAGAAGYVGSRLAQRLLEQGQRVRGLVCEQETESPQVEALAAQGMVVWTGDLTWPETLIGVAEGMDYVYNLTARSVLENGSVRRTFVDGNQHLIAACSRARRVRAYVFTSNTAPYGDAGEAFVSEDALIAPRYPLGRVMVEAEQVIMEAIRRHNFPAMILRVGTIYGPERDFIDSVINGTMTLIGDGRNFVSRIHIDDLLTVLERVATQGQPGAIYNVADDEPLRQIDLFTEVRERLGMLPPRTYPSTRALLSGMDPNVVGMASASVRLSNARLKHDLEIDLRYSDCRGWIAERLDVTEELEVMA